MAYQFTVTSLIYQVDVQAAAENIRVYSTTTQVNVNTNGVVFNTTNNGGGGLTNTNISQLTNDVGYLTTSTLPPYPTVPTRVSSFTNDTGYLTSATVNQYVITGTIYNQSLNTGNNVQFNSVASNNLTSPGNLTLQAYNNGNNGVLTLLAGDDGNHTSLELNNYYATINRGLQIVKNQPAPLHILVENNNSNVNAGTYIELNGAGNTLKLRSGNSVDPNQSIEASTQLDITAPTLNLLANNGFGITAGPVGFSSVDNGPANTPGLSLIGPNGKLVKFKSDTALFQTPITLGNNGYLQFSDGSEQYTAYTTSTRATIINLVQAIETYSTLNDTRIYTDITGTETAILHRFTATNYTTIKYLFRIQDGTSFEAGEIWAVVNDQDIYLSEFNLIENTGILGMFDADMNNGIGRLKFTPAGATNMGIRIISQKIVP